MTTDAEIFATDFAALAREIAMDIFPLAQVLKLHQLDDAEWQRISANKRFQSILDGMVREWNSAINTRERVRIKAATGLESVIETYIQEISDVSIPLTQRVEAGKFLARLGELDGNISGELGERFSITLNIGNARVEADGMAPKVIEHEASS
jgi:hypothetical protein